MMEKGRILVIEDEPSIQDVLRDYLTAAGYEVRTASDGLTGLTQIDSFKPDLLLLDINLPVKSGWDFLTEYKQLKMHGIDVYMLTSALDLLDANKKEEHPEVKDFVEKPLYDYKLESILSE